MSQPINGMANSFAQPVLMDAAHYKLLLQLKCQSSAQRYYKGSDQREEQQDWWQGACSYKPEVLCFQPPRFTMQSHWN